ncbi:hypothetical protein QBC39DRAFT_431957 [Podospora conica]|nr:hypothetical protein QBC39DRAFT_431957 [Schizothecium conicum]
MTTSSPPPAPPPLETAPSYQPDSPFFTRLPYEIRQQIYLDCFRASSLRQHILLLNNGHFTHTPCLTDPSSPDIRYTNFRNAPLASLERATWLQRLKTDWCLHWACGGFSGSFRSSRGGTKQFFEMVEAMLDKTTGPQQQRPTFLPVLLTCKQAYTEALPTLYRSLTFLFTDLTAAEVFLFTFPPPRSIELSIRLTNLLTELYFPYAELAANAGMAAAPDADGPLPTIKHASTPTTRLTAANNPWSRVCARLVALSHASPLSHLHIWLDTRDLRPWHKRVSETRMFGAALAGVRMRPGPGPGGSSRFVLALPELPADLEGDGGGEGPPVQQVIVRGLGAHHFLAAGAGEGRPFAVERGVRANNWSVHMGERVWGGGRM